MNNSYHVSREKIQTGLVLICIFIFLTGCAGNRPEKTPVSQPAGNTVGSNQMPPPNESSKNSIKGREAIDPNIVTYPEEQFNDPLEFANRPIFLFNDALYRYALIPVGKGYLKVIPETVRNCVSNAFSNIREPLNILNHLFQLHGKPAGTSFARFAVNSTIGLFGLFDPAHAWLEINEHETDLNDTLAVYGVGYGLYLVVPILGQSDARYGFSRLVESQFGPIALLTDKPETYYIQVFKEFHIFAPSAEGYQKLRDQTDDPYRFFRNLYMQRVLRDEQYKQN